MNQYLYRAFGEQTDVITEGISNRFTWVGRLGYYRKPDPKTYWLRARVYDPQRGRFVSRDPIGIWGDLSNLGNGYAYVAHCPPTRKDPFGLGVSATDVIKGVKTIIDFIGDTNDPITDNFSEWTLSKNGTRVDKPFPKKCIAKKGTKTFPGHYYTVDGKHVAQYGFKLTWSTNGCDIISTNMGWTAGTFAHSGNYIAAVVSHKPAAFKTVKCDCCLKAACVQVIIRFGARIDLPWYQGDAYYKHDYEVTICGDGSFE